jgi:two-component system torCAD operon response regulator TorR
MLIGAQQDDIEHIIGLELGADDYIARPFNERVLVARVKALLWRLGTGGRAGEQTGFKRFEGWQLDMTSHRLISPKGRGHSAYPR